VRKVDDGEREISLLSWGFVLLQDGRAPKRVTNTRDDKVRSGFWRDSFATRRCLVPASSFCEPHDGRKPATWHWFALKGEQPRPLFAFPGIWRRWQGPVKKGGPNVDIEVYSIMTTQPNALTASINHERLPVLLTEEQEFETWLSGSPAEAFGLVRSFDPDRMRIVQEGFDKEDLLAA
jgi:putative SOS response-associated peptidase YedK